MKKLQMKMSSYCLAALLILQAGVAQSAEHAVGIVKKVQGQVHAVAADGKSRRLVQSGDALAQGERVLTARDAGSSVTLQDGTELVLGASSSVRLEEFRFNSTTQEGNMLLDFLGGQMRVISGLIAKGKSDAMKVKAPIAIIGVRGTDFIVEAPNVKE